MSTIVYHIDSKTGNKYAYESKSYRDPDTKKVKTRKTYLGRVDPVTGKIIPKAEPGKRNRAPSTRQIDQISEVAKRQITVLSEEVTELRKTVSYLTAQLKANEEFVKTVLNASDKYKASTKPQSTFEE